MKQHTNLLTESCKDYKSWKDFNSQEEDLFSVR